MPFSKAFSEFMKKPFAIGLGIRFLLVTLYVAFSNSSTILTRLLHPLAFLDSILIWWLVSFFVVPYADTILFGIIFFICRKKPSVQTTLEALGVGILAGVLVAIGSYLMTFIIGFVSFLLPINF